MDKLTTCQSMRMGRSCSQDSKPKLLLEGKVILISKKLNSTKGHLHRLVTKGKFESYIALSSKLAFTIAMLHV